MSGRGGPLVACLRVALIAWAACGTPAEEALPDLPPLDLVVPSLTLDIVVSGPCAGLADNAPCDDTSACTSDDHCESGACVGTPVSCSGGSACAPALCDPLRGCAILPRADGATCSAPCFEAASCLGGECVGLASAPVVCPASPDPCVDRVACDPTVGTCSLPQYALACPANATCELREQRLECVPSNPSYCQPCTAHADCADAAHPDRLNQCLPVSDANGSAGSFCGSDCSAWPCPVGAECVAGQCKPTSGACACDAAWSSLALSTPCSRINEHGVCAGTRRCIAATLTACDAKIPTAERCNALDDNCDGQVDEDLEAVCGPSGACCTAAGGCKALSRQSCLASGGTPAGDGVACGEAPCGVSPGACCTGAQCAAKAPGACLGSYRGDGVTCDMAPCDTPPPTGACCLGDDCQARSVAECFALGGNYKGHGVTCEEAACKPTGACCFAGLIARSVGEAKCVQIDQQACVVQGGNFDADAICDAGECPVPSGSGACCTADGGCGVIGGAACAATPGQFLPGVPCKGQCTAPDLAACCSLAGDCSMRPIGACPAETSTWKGSGTKCPSACVEALGACCAGLNCYPTLSLAQCAFVQGDWAGPDTSCEDSCGD